MTGNLTNVRQLLKSLARPVADLSQLIMTPLVAFLPAPLAYSLAWHQGDWRYRYDYAVRKAIIHNLEDVLGDHLTSTERAYIARDIFRLRSCDLVDLARKGQTLAHLVEIRGREHLEAALAQGQGAILCGAHFGSFAIITSVLLSNGFPVTAVNRLKPTIKPFPHIARFLWHSMFNRHVTNYSHRPVIQPWPGQPAGPRIANALHNNEVITICIDPPPLAADLPRAIPVKFLGRQVLLLAGSAGIAHHTHTPILMTFLYRQADWQHQVLEISPPISMDGGVEATFGRCIAAVEEAILREPAHWDFWYERDMLGKLGLLPSTDESIPASSLDSPG